MQIARYIFSPQEINVIVKQEFGQGFMKAPGDKLETVFCIATAGRVGCLVIKAGWESWNGHNGMDTSINYVGSGLNG